MGEEWYKNEFKRQVILRLGKTITLLVLVKNFLVHPKLYLTMTALYNLNNEGNNPVHPRRFQMRIGFQVSELATRKRKITTTPIGNVRMKKEKVKYHLCVAILLFAPFVAIAQSTTFSSQKVGAINQLASKSDTISFSDYVETQPGTSERLVTIHGSEYKIVHRKAKGGLKEVFDSLGSKIASIPLAGPNRQSILLANGRTLKFQATGKESWSYTKNGKDAISGYYYVWENKKYYVVHRDDSTITNSVVPAIFLEYGLGNTHVYHNSKRTGAILTTVGVSTMLVLFKLATEDDDDF